MQVKKGDWIEVDYVGRLKASGKIFDLTKADVAKAEDIFDKKHSYRPLVVALGADHLLKGLDAFLDGKEVGREYQADIQPQDAFGVRNPKLIQLTSLRHFKEKKVNPVPGLQLVIDGALATIRSVSGGRVILDFNHPLAGRMLSYWIKINKLVKGTDEKIQALASLLLNLKPDQYKLSLKEGAAVLELKKEMPKLLIERLKAQAKELIPELKSIKISVAKIVKKPAKK